VTRWVLHGNHPEVGSGYGGELAILAEVLASMYGRGNIAISTFHGHAGFISEWHGMRVYPTGQDLYGGDIVGMHATHFGADIVLSLMDNWALRHETLAGIHNHVAWMPVDCDNQDNPAAALGVHDVNRLMANPGTVVLAVSRFGYDVVAQAKEHLLLPNRLLYLPHFIDTGVFKPLPNREQVRETMGLTGRFAVLTVAANRDQARKNFPHQFEAFRRFHAAHDDPAKGPVPILILHTEESNPRGTDLRQTAERVGLPAGSFRFSAQYPMAAGMIPGELLAGSMAAADLGLQASMAEGFGLPIAEMLACGTPVVTTRGSAMTEVAGPGGWAVRGEKAWARGHDAWWRMPSQDGLVRALNEAYKKGPAYHARRQAARRHIEENYAVDVVVGTHLRPVLKHLHDHFGVPDDRVA
jgi:glycosyltransferase involved in cell wall biosynthesis